MKHFVLCTLGMLCSVSVFSQYSVTGKIIDKDTGLPVDFGNVVLFQEGKYRNSTESDPTGAFRLEQEKGIYDLEIQMIGYTTYKTSITISGHLNMGTIALMPASFELEGVEVVVKKKQVIYKLDKRIIEASSSLLAAGGTAIDILEATPSIRVNAEGDVSFRGSSGFTVYVDGKPSVFSGTQALQQIPAGQIDNIEIITTPSAQYDTQGDVGIINIITKKNYGRGLNGFVNINGSTVGSRGVDLLLTGQKGASQWYVGGFATNQFRKSDFEQEKTTIVNDTTTVSDSEGPRESKWYMYLAKGGWSLNKPKTSYSIDGEVGYGGNKRKGDLDYSEQRSTDGNLFEEGKYKSRDMVDIDETYGQTNLSVNHKFNEKGHTANARFYAKYGGNSVENFQSDLFDYNNNRLQGHGAWEKEFRWTVRGNIDYVYPYRESGQLKAGYQYYSYLEDGDYKMQFWNPETQSFYWRDDIYNTFYFGERINSIYAVIADSYKAFELQVGVRGEHTRQELRSSIEGTNRLYRRFEFFPSVHSGWNLSENRKILFSYSRRTNRPELYFMEPYITYKDYYTAEIGNPDIRPEYINSFELNYSYNGEQNSLSASAFHRSRKDKIERLRVPYVAGVTLDSMANVGHDYATGIELSASIQTVRWWNVRLNGSVYHYKVENEFKNSGEDETSTNYEIALYNNLEWGKSTRIQLDGNFVGPSVTTQGKTNSFWYINLAIRQQLLKNKLTATLSFRDVFNTARYTSNITTADLQSHTRISPKYPLISLSISYTFNQFTLGNNNNRRSSHDLFEGTSH